MTEEFEYTWEYPVTGTPLASSLVLTEWVHRIGSALEVAVGDLALVEVRIEAVGESAGEVVRVSDPAGRGPTIEILMERLPSAGADYVFALVDANAIVPEALRPGWRSARVDVEAGYVDGRAESVDGARLEFSRGDTVLVERIAEVVRFGLSVSKRRRWRRLQIAIPAYGGRGDG